MIVVTKPVSHATHIEGKHREPQHIKSVEESKYVVNHIIVSVQVFT